MKRKQIDAILSDYDGTLCSTTSVRGGIGLVDTIPQELEQILFRISKRIPVCIISSKDFIFLHKRTRFANILSCVLGIETIIHNSHYISNNNEINNSCIICRELITNRHSLEDNSKLLHNIVEILQTHNYKDIIIEEKYTSNRKIPFIQIHSSHPFLDVYGVECNKGLAFDNILLHLEKKNGGANIMYLGDSENDNPAFRKSDISIGIHSDTRLIPILDCKYMLDFNQLPQFLMGLADNDFIFSESLLPNQAD